VGNFEVDLFMLMGQEMNDQAVEEFAKYFIGRPNQWAEIVTRSVLLVRPTAPAPKPRPKIEPAYIVRPPEPEPEPEEKRGLLGSLKSFIKKD